MDRAPKSRHDDLYARLKQAWDCREYEQAKMALDKLSDDYRQKYPDLAGFVSEHGWETLGCTTHARWNIINDSGQQT